MTELHISKKDEGQRLNKYLMKYLNAAPASFIYKMLRKKNIVINQKRAKGDEIIHEADVVILYLSDETINNFRKEKETISPDKKTVNLKILYMDDDIMAVHKPAGILSQKASAADYSINESIVDYCRQNCILSDKEFETFTPSVCNRLDRNTSGIILAGISLKGSRYLSDMLKQRTSDKFYYTIIYGIMPDEIHDIAYIYKDKNENKSEIINAVSYKQLTPESKKKYSKIETCFTPIDTAGGYSLIKVKLITGKSHQIRAHLKNLGFAVAGDTKYGDKKTNKILKERFKLKHHLLHAGEVIIPDYITNQKLVIRDMLPEQFKKVCVELGLKTTNI